jgi:hypothetical protein
MTPEAEKLQEKIEAAIVRPREGFVGHRSLLPELVRETLAAFTASLLC